MGRKTVNSCLFFFPHVVRRLLWILTLPLNLLKSKIDSSKFEDEARSHELDSIQLSKVAPQGDRKMFLKAGYGSHKQQKIISGELTFI